MSRTAVEQHLFSARQAAKFLGVSPTTVLKALNTTDPASYPPPLQHAGRHGEGGRFAITRDALLAWADSLARFG